MAGRLHKEAIMTDRLSEIKSRLDKASYERRPLKLHFGCKNPPACSVCTEYTSAYIEWESYLMDLQLKAPDDIKWLIEELERERLKTATTQSALQIYQVCDNDDCGSICDSCTRRLFQEAFK